MVARFSVEANYKAMTHELMWLQTFLGKLRIYEDGPMRLYCDNKVAINIAHNSVQYDSTKYIEIQWHFIKEKLRV